MGALKVCVFLGAFITGLQLAACGSSFSVSSLPPCDPSTRPSLPMATGTYVDVEINGRRARMDIGSPTMARVTPEDVVLTFVPEAGGEPFELTYTVAWKRRWR